MNVVRGKVVTQEMHRPLADLLVVALDFDPRGTASTLDALVQSERLGSVLTAADGTFVLEFADDLHTAGEGNEPRPDIVVIVVAPEDTATSGSALASDLARRLLHVSVPVRMAAGRTESWMIRIAARRLEELGVPLGPTDTSMQEAASFTTSVRQRLELDTAVRADAAFNAAFAAQRDAARKGAADARAFVEQLWRREVASKFGLYAFHRAEVPALVARAVDDGLRAMAARDRRIQVPISPEVAARIASRPEQAAAAAVKYGAVDRARERSLLEACLAREACRRHGPPPAPPSDGSPAVPSPPPEPPQLGGDEARDFVRARVLGQIAAIRPWVREDVPPKADRTALQRKLEEMALRGGPADVAAYHDFHSLQIAFQSVWQRVFDRQLGRAAEALYQEWVKLRDYSGTTQPIEDAAAELAGITDFLAAAERDVAAAEELANRTDSEANERGQPRRRRVELRSVPGSDDRRPAVEMYPAEPVTPQGDGLGADRAEERDASERPLVRARRLFEGIASRLAEPYAFDVFQPNTFNFGIMVSYRQCWEPQTYQAGALVASMPLAPGEKRTVTARQVVNQTRMRKELESASSAQNAESATSARADAEIVRRASTSTNFSQTVTGGFSLGELVQIGSSTQFGANQANESQQRKQDFRESVRRAAEEYRRERSIEVSSREEQETETTQVHEIGNPNNEITVTYLFYELQRRYRVSERLRGVRPVILVAQDVPSPDQIDEDWLLAHEPVLRRVFVDPAHRQALDYLRASLAGDEVAVQALAVAWRRNLSVVEHLASQLAARRTLRDDVRQRIVDLLGRVQRDDTTRDVAAAVFSGGLSLLVGGGGDSGAVDAAKDAAGRELELADSDFAELEGRLRQAVSALEAATDKYVAALRAQLGHRVAVDQLRVLVKENIIPIMHAIWSHEPPDQRLFRLYDLTVPWFELASGVAASVVEEAPAATIELGVDVLRALFDRIRIRAEFDFTVRPRAGRRLADVADLDSPLGFKGNYMIFPLRESNPLTDFMMQDYKVDEIIGVLDPDDSGNVDAQELEAVLRCLERDPDIAEGTRQQLQDLICRRMVSDRRDAETIVVPTGQLFIEALPGTHAVLEDFKLRHRALDEMKVEAEIRAMELENLRRADRMVERQLEDPDVDRLVRIEGGSTVHVET